MSLQTYATTPDRPHICHLSSVSMCWRSLEVWRFSRQLTDELDRKNSTLQLYGNELLKKLRKQYLAVSIKARDQKTLWTENKNSGQNIFQEKKEAPKYLIRFERLTNTVGRTVQDIACKIDGILTWQWRQRKSKHFTECSDREKITKFWKTSENRGHLR